MSNILKFIVQGSEGEEYDVNFKRIGDRLTATCSCVSGKMKRGFCKHRLDLMFGDFTNLVDPNFDDLESLPDLLEGTTAAPHFQALRDTYGKLHEANAQLAEAKKGVKKIEDEINGLKDKLLTAMTPPSGKR
ncbi:MAG: hypothetical protein PHW76_05600 [Alphaproteobacteria bacterium]|nr:hypothetical protein [Alphaproteobacteria bacterium]